MSLPRAWRRRVVVRHLVQGLVRSFVLVGLTGFLPGLGLAAVFFFGQFESTVGVVWSCVGVLAVGLVVLSRPTCRVIRLLVARWGAAEIAEAYRPTVPVTRMATGFWWNGYDYQRLRVVSVCVRWIRARVSDPASWRDMLWMLIAPCTVGLASAVPVVLIAAGILGWAAPTVLPVPLLVAALVLVVGVALLPVGWRSVGPLARRLLGPSALARLTTRVASLVQGRADLTQAQEAELRRIERDLHDGAQARLVSIGLSLGVLERLVDTDPAEAKLLLRQTRDSSLVALGELRELVHGIVPPVLLERGLVDAVRALALDTPVPSTVRSSLDHRIETPIEAALYFATAELIANVVKHAQASALDIVIDRTRTGVTITVTDDGRGGARVRAGSGLDGVQRRVRAFDGELHLDSPLGGPTRATVGVPCA